MTAPSFVEFVAWLGVELTPGQRALALVIFDGVDPCDLSDGERMLARQLFGPVERVPAAAKHVGVLVCGARGGKSYLLALRALHLSLTAHLDSLAPGERAFAITVAPDLRLAQQLARYVEGAVSRQRSLKALVQGQTQTSLVLRRPDGHTIECACLPAAEAGRSLRGRTLVFAGLDESAFFRAEGAAVADADLFRAVAPRVVRGGQVLVASTPWGEEGLLFELWRDNFGDPKTALVAHAPTLILRDDPHTRAIVERERQRDPRNCDREFDARFGSTDEALLDGGDVDRAVDRGRFETQRVEGVRYGLAIDLATRHDFSVALAGHRELEQREGAPPAEVLVIDCARHWEPTKQQRIDPEQLEAGVTAIANHYRCSVIADGWGFDFFAARLKQRGVVSEQASMASSEQAKRAGLLAAAFRQGRVSLPDGNGELVKQLKTLRVTRHAGGRLSFAAPNRRGRHDDYPKALLLLIERAQTLPAAGRGISFTWKAGRRLWFSLDSSGNRLPCQPPESSRDWLAMVLECQGRGVSTPDIERWLSEPANVEALEHYKSRNQGRSLAALGIR